MNRNRAPAPPPPSAEAIDALVRQEHARPHELLGPHAQGGMVVIRAFRPDADSMYLIRDGKLPLQMSRVHPAGLFELSVRARKPFPYRLQIGREGERPYRDPYAFPPTLGDLDLHLFNEGTHHQLYERLGARVRTVQGVRGVSFATWAPNATRVSVVGDFNRWDGRLHMMRALGNSGIWEIFIPELEAGALYKFEIRTRAGQILLKADPYALRSEPPPATASVLWESRFRFEDREWTSRRSRTPHRSPLSIYEVHLGSWRRVPEEQHRPLSYREMAPFLCDYVQELGFTHVELMPVLEHPFGGSWGYQVTSYFAPTARFGTPDDLKFLIDSLHRRGIGVILDWVPAHFPNDAFALARFDGTSLYEHEDPRRGVHPDWGSLIFNYGRPEVRNFLLASALYWFQEFHVDGLRMDAVASMLYLDYSRSEGDWVPNRQGGREDLEAIAFLRQLNDAIHERVPEAITIAEESTAWPGVSRPPKDGGLGFNFKWDMGWMHDTLAYFSQDPIYRRYHHKLLTFGLLYAWNENFILPLSHDEVVHGKGSLLQRMHGDRWRKFANLRALYGYMWARPGKKHLFMGNEFGQWREWNHEESLDWHLLAEPEHRNVQHLVRDLNRLYRENPSLWEDDHDPAGFQWIDVDNADENVIAFLRISKSSGPGIVCACNFSAIPRYEYVLGLPKAGTYAEILNTDSEYYGGGNVGNLGAIVAKPEPWKGQPFSTRVVLPPLATVWFRCP